MTREELKQWIAANIGEGRWLEFAEQVNEVRKSKKLKPLSLGAVSSWLYEANRNPPAYVESYLPLIKARLDAPADVAEILTLHIPLDKQQRARLRHTAKAAGVTVEDFAMIIWRAGFDAECGDDHD